MRWTRIILPALLAASCGGCAVLHHDRKATEEEPRYHIQVSGEAVSDQLLEVPEEGITVGEAIDACRESNSIGNSNPAENAFVIVAHNDRRIIFPYSTVADGRTASIFLKPADRLVLTNGIVASHSPARPINVVVGGLSPVRGEKVLFPDPTNNQFAVAEMLLQLGILNENEERVGPAQASELIRLSRANGDVWLLPLGSDALQDTFVNEGDKLEMTAFAMAPEIIRGDAAARARMIVEREIGRRAKRAKRVKEATQGGSLGAIGRTFGAVGRTVVGVIP